MKNQILMVAFWAICVSLFGQNKPCNISQSELQKMGENLLDARRNMENFTRNGEKYVPVNIIEINQTDGSGHRPKSQYLAMLCRINEVFSPAGVRFYLANDQVFQLNDNQMATNQSGDNLLKIKLASDTNAVNLVCVETVDFGNGSPNLTQLSIAMPSNKLVLIKKNIINIPNADISHNIGHYFNLLHTCHGWEQGWPAGDISCAAVVSPTGILTEKVSGLNADIAGDFIADTPADYNFIWDDMNCADGYNGFAKDPDCVPLQNMVDMHNAMSFGDICPPFALSFGQGDAVLADLAMNSNKYLQNNYFPPAEMLVAPPNFMLEPSANAQTPFNNQFYFKWESVPNATFYLLEINQTGSTTSPSIYSEITNNTELTISNLILTSNLNYFWRVTPYNSFATCTTPPPARKFISGLFAVSTTDFSEKVRVEMRPNPAQSGQSLDITLQSTDNISADLSIFNATGKIVFLKENAFSNNHFYLNSTLNNFPTGLYFVQINTKLGTQTLKLLLN